MINQSYNSYNIYIYSLDFKVSINILFNILAKSQLHLSLFWEQSLK